MAKLDYVIPYRRSKTFDRELRFALRSLSNYKNLGKVWIIGEKPGWVQNVEFIPMHQTSQKSVNARNAILTACKAPVSDEFILAADDIYIMKPMDDIELYHGGPLDAFLDKYNSRYPLSYYTNKVKETAKHFPANPNHYELHVPFKLRKEPALSLLTNPTFDNMMFRTLYGNLVLGGQGTETTDVKYYQYGSSWYKDIEIGFFSSDDSKFRGEIEMYLRKLFPEKSIYETRD